MKTMTILEKLLARSNVKDMRLNLSKSDDEQCPYVFASIWYYNTNLHSYVSSQSQILFTFSMPWDMLHEEKMIEEELIDFNDGRTSLSLMECSEALQNEVLKRMIVEKQPCESLFVEKYADGCKWEKIVIIPSVSCLEELEIMLDLENEESHD